MLYEAIKRLRPGVHFELTQDGTNNNQPYISLWLSTEPMPSQVEINAMITTIEAEREAAATEAQQLRQLILSTAASAVGVPVGQWTQAQMRALLAILLHKEGGLDKAGAVRPLQDWMR